MKRSEQLRHVTVVGYMNRNSNEWAHLVAQAHGLYLRLRDRAGDEVITHTLVQQAYDRYQRRIMRRH